MVTLRHSDTVTVDAVTVRLTNPSHSLAFLVRARLTDAGREILPVIWSDNYVSLLPGESRVLRAKFGPGAGASNAQVKVDGFNIVPNWCGPEVRTGKALPSAK